MSGSLRGSSSLGRALAKVFSWKQRAWVTFFFQEPKRPTFRGSCPYPQKAHFNWFPKVPTSQWHIFGIWTSGNNRHRDLIPKT